MSSVLGWLVPIFVIGMFVQMFLIGPYEEHQERRSRRPTSPTRGDRLQGASKSYATSVHRRIECASSPTGHLYERAGGGITYPWGSNLGAVHEPIYWKCVNCGRTSNSPDNGGTRLEG